MTDSDPTAYETADGEPLPDKVLANVAPPEEWDARHTSPENVPTPVIAGPTEVYHVVTDDGTEEFLDKSGHSYGRERDHDLLGASWHSVEYALDPRLTHMHRDMKAEHVTTVVVATPRGVFKHYSRSGAAWTYAYATREGINPDDVTDDMLQLAESLADAPREYKPDRPDGFEKLTKSAWHSSMEQSELTERINGITRGDAHRKLGWSFPVVVRFGDTRNVCSQPYSIYAPTMHRDTVIDALSDARGIGRKGLKKKSGRSAGVGSRAD